MNYTIKIAAIIIALAISLPFALNAQDNTFTGTTNADWDIATNWSTGAVPTSPITGIITIAANCTNENAVDYTFQSGSTLKVNSGVSFTNNGTGTWTMQGTIINEGTYTQTTLANDGTYVGTSTFVGHLINNGLMEPGSPPPSWSCGDPLVYSGQSYATVQIGTQCWMAENLNIGTMITGSTNMTNNGVIEKYCYDNNTSNCDIYGGLYQWNEMMQYVTTESTQGVCPTGWHIPSDTEWTTLTDYVKTQSGYWCNSNSNYIAKALAATTNWNTYNGTCSVGNNLSANNATGFSVLPGGYRLTNGSFYGQGSNASLWSSTELGSSAWLRYLLYNDTDVSRYGYNKDFGFSVRCVRD